MKLENDLNVLTSRGHLDTSEVVMFLKETGIMDNKNWLSIFRTYLHVANYNGYIDGLEFAKKIKEQEDEKRD